MIKDLKRLIGNDGRRLAAPIVLSVIDSLFYSMMYGIMLMVFADLADGGFTRHKLTVCILAASGIFIVRCLLQASGFTMIQCTGANVTRKLRLDIGNHIRDLNLGYFNNNSIGKLNSVLTTDITDYEAIITHSLCDLIKVISFGIMSVLFLAYISPVLAAVILAVIIVALPFLLRSGKASGASATRLKNAKSSVVTRIVEYVSGIKTFRLYKLTGERFSALDSDLKELKDASVKSELSVLPLSLAFYVMTSVMIPATIIIGGILYKNGSVSATMFILSLFITVSLADMVGILSSLYPQIKSVGKATKNICGVLDENPFGYDPSITKLDSLDIEYSNVSFSYQQGVKVLDGVSFRAAQGTTTALIGPSGSGKTTMISLLSRFFDVTGGSITIGGTDIKNIAPDVLTRYMSVVFQDVYLLNDTIMNNIRIGDPNATDEQVYAVAKAACCHEFIMKLDDGYQTMLGEGGAGLSGGEKQRISIARALLKNAPIVLLDETTSNLDADNEKEINTAFSRLMKGKTVLVIAHRLETIRNADNIIVISKGKVKEQGTHAQLMQRGGWYSAVCREQEAARNWHIKNDEVR